jgi:glycosyltransferase involved in cell wall biosynthesis
VVVPCYNYGHYLPACVESVLGQPGVDVDLLIVDDASTDGSGDVAERLAARDPRISVVRHAKNAGHIATYNEGLEQTRGEYVVLLSADDLLTPGALSRATAIMEQHPSVGFVYGPVAVFGGDQPPVARTHARSWVLWPSQAWLRRRWRSARNCVWSPEAVMRATVRRQLGGFRAEFPHAGDLDLWMRAAAIADVAYVEGADQAFYRMHDTNMHRTVFEGERRAGDLVDMRERWRTFDRLASELPGAELTATRRALAAEALKTASRWSTWGDADAGVADDLVSFACEIYPAASSLPWWHLAADRRRLGPHVTWSRNPGFLLQVNALGAHRRARRWRWERLGSN